VVLLAVLVSPSPDEEGTVPDWSSVPKIYFDTPISVEKDANFTVGVNITSVEAMWGAQFDVKYDYEILTYVSASPGAVNGTPPDAILAHRVGKGPGGEGMLRVMLKWDDYAEAHGGYGVNGSGCLCKLTFYAGPDADVINLGFVEGQGDPPGVLMISRAWMGNVYEYELRLE
jgi:hypothetical protein